MLSGKIAGKDQLKKLYRKLAKELHPDTGNSPPGRDTRFVDLKDSYDEAQAWLSEKATIQAVGASTGPTKSDDKRKSPETPDAARCRQLFSELVSSNFPIGRRARGNLYLERVIELDRQIGLFGPAYAGLFLDAEKELYDLKGSTVISNHIFNLVKLYLNNMSDWFQMKNSFSKTYLKSSYRIVIAVLEEKKAQSTIRLIDWFLEGIL